MFLTGSRVNDHFYCSHKAKCRKDTLRLTSCIFSVFVPQRQKKLQAVMNKIGFNVLAWSAVISEELFPILDRLKSIGYDGVEFLVGSPDLAAYKRVGEFAEKIGLEVTTVFVVGKEENPISESAATREKALDRIKW